ncbi:multicopper oxidase domain-containing protein [Methylobacter luteus]|uniref:multicopper oxidase domain-containing protein n=1 Tax=Methylobacter luteus TaxID=415 RepID=UPI000401ED85|nr:multicopper oxidase domain-containing protein [Methylobacter luteus]
MKIHEILFVMLILFISARVSPASAITREYFIAAEDTIWDFAPSNRNLIHCHDSPCSIPEPWASSHSFPSTRYIQYTDSNFATKVTQPEWLGILGPIIRAEVGDTIIVHFCNRSSKGAYSMHPHALRYNKEDEGAHYVGVNSRSQPGGGAKVKPGACYNYTWMADEESGPDKGDLSSKVWWYHTHFDESSNINSGLLGPIVITRKGFANPDGSPRDVDREFFTAFFVFDKAGGEEKGLMHSINGYIFGNLKGLIMKNGEKVRWHVMAMGNEIDLHTAHWHGKTVRVGEGPGARRTDVIELLPASMVTADMNANNPGEWMYHCHVTDHIEAGMATSYLILE